MKNRLINKLISFIAVGILWVTAMAFTVYVFLNVYEQLTENDIAIIPNVVAFNRSTEINQYLSCQSTDLPDAYYKFDEQIRYLEVPQINARVELSAPIRRDQLYYTRGNKSHLINNPIKNELIIYSRNSWRTMRLAEDTLNAGDLIFLSTENGKRYIFKIETKSSQISCAEENVEQAEEIKPAEPRLKVVTDIGGEMVVYNSVFINTV